MVDDLVQDIQKALDAHEQVLLLIDANEDVQSGYLQEKLEAIYIFENIDSLQMLLLLMQEDLFQLMAYLPQHVF